MPESRENSSAALRAIDDAAAAWVARRDRGLAPAEQDEFFQWLAADPRHGERLARHQRGWSELAQLAQWRPEHGAEPNPDVLAPPSRSRPQRRRLLPWLAPAALAAACVAVFLIAQPKSSAPHSVPLSVEPGQRQQVLDDGTLADLNRGALLTAAFTAGERRVRLARGEAHFTVAKNPARPFVVEAGGVTVRAIGTAFNVRLGEAAVEVLVTEGRVEVDRPATPFAAPPLVTAGQRTVVPLTAAAPTTAALTLDEIDRALAWQPKLLEFAATPLAEVAVQFNRRNRVQLVIADEALRALPIGASFRSDNVDGFVRLLEASFGVAVMRDGDTITLRRAR